MTRHTHRIVLVVGLLGAGLAAQTALEASYKTTRPPLNAPLSSLPLVLGDWVGHDEPMDPQILERTQADDYLNRVYEHRKYPGRAFKLWMNYSASGLNMRHSPEVCLPSGGWSRIESLTREITVPRGEQAAKPTIITRLGYSQADVVQGIGFWYYIFGQGRLEQFARSLPITNRSSHGRTTRGSGLTVEVFYPGDFDPEGSLLTEFSKTVLDALEPFLPEDRVAYHVP